MLIPVNNVGEHGIIIDRAPWELPLNAWSGGQNVHFTAGYAEKMDGHSGVLGTPTVAPYWLMTVPQTLAYYWVYAGLAKVYVTDGATHVNITRQTTGVDVDYAATADKNWTGGILGGIPVLNNGVDLPQMWLPTNTSTRLSALSTWPATYVAGAMRPFKNFLVALDITKVVTRYPQMVKWSHPADPGAVPASWDPTDTTKDAGEVELKDSPDYVVDCAPLRDINIIYKENSTYGMQFIGGVNIFRFFRIFASTGILSRRCAVEFFSGKHAVFGDGDILVHDGQNAQSIVSAKLKKRIFNSIDNTTYQRSFVVADAGNKEVWFCFPETNQTLPSLALVWNYEFNTTGFRELPNPAHIEPGVVNPGSTSDQWGAVADSWASGTGVWDQRNYNPTLHKLLMAQSGAPLLLYANNTTQFSGVNMTSYVERTGLALPMRVNQPPDVSTIKKVTRLWPRIEGTAGETVQVYVGGQMEFKDPVVYKPPVPYVIGSNKAVDIIATSRLPAVKFASTTALSWKLHGYEMEVFPVGVR